MFEKSWFAGSLGQIFNRWLISGQHSSLRPIMPDSQKSDIETIKHLIRTLWRDIPPPNVISAYNDEEARICIGALSGKTYEEMPFGDSPFYGTNTFEACTPEANCYFLAGYLLYALDLAAENMGVKIPYQFSTDIP